MIYTQEKIYELALSALLLSEEVTNVATNTTNRIKILNRFYDIALESTLQDLDLDSLSGPIILELVEELPEAHSWDYAYKYPTNCAFFRRLDSGYKVDNETTHIPKRTGMHDGQKTIFTNEAEAIAECIPKDISLAALSPMAGLAVAYMLAILASPAAVGKGAKTLRKEIKELYIVAKAEAQETDILENFNYESAASRSPLVRARLS